MQPLTEWLELMLGEIERKRSEAHHAAEEEARRRAAAERSGHEEPQAGRARREAGSGVRTR